MSLALAITAVLLSASVASAATLSQRDQPRSGNAASFRPAFLPASGKSATLNIAEPIAHIADVNTVVPAFELGFSYSQVKVGKLKLQEVLIKPVDPGESVKGGCSQCTGSGSFLPYTIKNRLFTEGTRGNIFLSGKTKIVEALVRPGQIGRFKLYGVSIGPPTQPALLAQGCLPADIIALAGGTTSGVLNALLHPKTLPRVSCSASANPRGDNVTFFRPPFELSATQHFTGEFKGFANGSRWLTAWEGHQTNCGPDPLAEARRGFQHVIWPVHGKFDVVFNTALVSRAGFFCAYLQNGGTFDGLPDGRVGITWSVPYYAGDTVTIGGPTSAAVGSTIQNTFSGQASAPTGRGLPPEELWVFDSTSPCAATAGAEFGPSFGLSNTAVNGNFSVQVTSVKLTQSGFRCAYLNVGAPTKKNGLPTPTGPTLASASLPITVP